MGVSRPVTGQAERIVDLYQRHAHAWAADRGSALREQGWLDRFRCLLPDRSRVLDLGCGTGEPIARSLIAQGCRLLGIDAAPAMIAMARDLLPCAEWRVGDMRALMLERQFDGLLAWDSFFHLCHEDQRRMFAVFVAHAAPGAVLMFTTGTSHGVAIGTLYGEPLYHASLGADEYRAMLDACGFDLVAHVVNDQHCGRTVWLAQAR